MKSVIIILGLVFIFSACNATKSESLLSDDTSCTVEDCSNTQTSIEGELSIASDQSSYQLNVDQSDVIEIAGKCNDLGNRENSILVQVFEGENEPEPYIDNDLNYLCSSNSKTASIQGLRCFWVTQGIPLVADPDDAIRELPRCHNGRFAFAVRLGRIIRTTDTAGAVDDFTNPRKKYLVRYKLYVSPTQQSQWGSATVDRTVTQVSFNQVTALGSFKCNIKVDAYKNLEALTDISYVGTLTREYINGALDTPNTNVFIPNITLSYPTTSDVSILDWSLTTNLGLADGQLIPGVKHKINITAYDDKYDYSTARAGGAHEHSVSSEDVECGYQRAELSAVSVDNEITSCAVINKTCNLTLSFPLGITTGALEWMFIKNKDITTWDEKYEPSPALPACGGVGVGEGCTMTELAPFSNYKTFRPNEYTNPARSCAAGTPTTHNLNGDYAVAVRYVLSPTHKGAWSKAINCSWSQ